MTMKIRQACVIFCCLAIVSSVHAQSTGGIPDETVLNRYGLTLSWWGRAVVNGRRDVVLSTTADEQNVYVQSSSGVLTTFNAESGRRMWSTLVGSPDQRAFPATSNDEEVMVSTGMQVYSFNKNNGQLLWQLKVKEHPSTSPAVDEKQIAVGTVEGSVFVYNIAKVRELHQERMLPNWSHLARMWNFKTPETITSPPIYVRKNIVFGSQKGIIYGLQAEDKSFKFQFESNARIMTPIGNSRDSILVIDDDSRLYCLNQENGRTRWTFSSGAPMRQQARVIGQQVFVVPDREGMSALSMVSGRALWTQLLATEFLAASETRVYASDIRGDLLILNRSTGKVVGHIPLGDFKHRVNNERTDRIFMTDATGVTIGIRELDSEFPAFHYFPERRPILPPMAAEDDADATPPASDDNENPFGN